MSDNLKKCPFCHGEAEIKKLNNLYFVRCSSCNAQVYFTKGSDSGFELTKEKVTKLWNNRR